MDQNLSITIMCVLTALIVLIYIAKNMMFNLMLLRASDKMHNKMINKLIRAPVEFFDTNPVGRILNRFSNDIGVTDRTISTSATDVAEVFFSVLSQVITVIIISPLTLIPSLFASVLIGFTLVFSYQSIKQCRDHELSSRSPMYSLFSATLSGLLIIRNYDQQNNFELKFRDVLYDNVKANIAYRKCSRFFGFYVDYIYNIAAICTLFIITALKDTNPDLFGLSVSYILGIAGVLSFGLRQGVQANVLMASVKRVQEYCHIPSEAPLALPEDEKLEDWPKESNIEFSDVYMRYRKNTDHIIKGLGFEAKPGEKIGCIGRTGAGKSSIIQILFRMIEIDRENKDHNESYLKIDGVDTQTLGLHKLRNNISIIPQTPFVFSGTVRTNLDPLNPFPAEYLIWDAF